MRSRFILLLMLLMTTCTKSIESAQTISPTPASLPPTLTAVAESSQHWEIYSSDPQHLWNRVFRQFFARTASDGTEYGWDSIDPLLWRDTNYLLEGKPNEQSLQLLDELLSSHGEDLIRDPIKRAMFQWDMWSVFDWLASRYGRSPSVFRDRIANVIQRVALSQQEIESLPANYAAASSSGIFASSFQTEQPDAPFLPADLYSPDSGWVCVGRLNGPIAMTHTQEFPFFGRSVFLVYIRASRGKATTLNLLNAMNTESSPELPDGTEVALVRRVLLIDKEGEIILSPLVASIQLRHFKTSPEQFFYQFQISRPLLFEGIAGGFQPVDKEISLFQSGGDIFRSDCANQPGCIMESKIPSLCLGCHTDFQAITGVNSILSYSRRRFPLLDEQRPVLIETTPEREAQNVIVWKLMDQTWEPLRASWWHSSP